MVKKMFMLISVCMLLLSALTGCEEATINSSVKLAQADLSGVSLNQDSRNDDSASTQEDNDGEKETADEEDVKANLELSDDSATDGSADQTSVAKYSVDTILGGTGKGIVDSSLGKAKISDVLEIAVDGQNNVCFIDNGKYTGQEYSDTPYLRKLNVDLKTVETVNIQEDMLNKFALREPQRIAYDSITNSLFVLCFRTLERNALLFQMDTDNITTATKITDKIDIVPSLFTFIDSENLILHKGETGNKTFTVTKDGEIESLDGLFGKLVVKEIIPDDNGLYVIYEDRGIKLAYAQFFPRQTNEIKLTTSIDKIADVAAFGDAFYAMSSKGIYKINTDGKVSIFIDFKDLTFNDGNDGWYSKFAFDSDGNVIVYDYKHGSLRKINMN